MSIVTRFAPSPTGPLHLGHAYSAILAHDIARAGGGRFLLRVDDLDQTRSRPEWEALIFEDLAWLGLTWDGPVRRQSEHMEGYRSALTRLARDGCVYPCSCKRRDILAAATAPQESGKTDQPATGPDGLIYPGTCRGRPMSDMREGDALRYDLGKSLAARPDGGLAFAEEGPLHPGRHRVTARHLMTQVGDPVIARPGMAAAYHFAVNLDDAETGVTHVVRGDDLFEATFLQRFLQSRLNLTEPVYHHHRLIRDAAGKRLAKRDDARAIRTYRDQGTTPAQIRQMLGLSR